MAERENAHLETGNALETPFGISDGLNQVGFVFADRQEFCKEALNVRGVELGVFGGSRTVRPVSPFLTAFSEDFGLSSELVGPGDTSASHDWLESVYVYTWRPIVARRA